MKHKDMSRKIVIIIIIVVVIIALGGGAVYYFIFRSTGNNQNKSQANKAATNNLINTDFNINNSAVINNDINNPSLNKESELQGLASSFAERFGSYSNQSDFENFEHLKIYMTKSMAAWADRYVEENRAKNINTSSYYGISTKSLKTETLVFSEADGQATFMVSTQRKESRDNASELNVFYQDIKIIMVKKEGWLVNEAWWQ